eukprot:scaffold2419_cov114-Isochrysis_galbana.AAC.8
MLSWQSAPPRSRRAAPPRPTRERANPPPAIGDDNPLALHPSPAVLSMPRPGRRRAAPRALRSMTK